jgi:hypothetical protein
MLSKLQNNLIKTLVGTLVLAVVASGVHAKDLVGISLPAIWGDVKKQVTSDQPIVKVAGDLHTHVDKQISKMPTASGGDNPQADSRSLRLLHDQRKDLTHRFRVAGKLKFWWQLTTLTQNS